MSREICFLCGILRPRHCMCWRSVDNFTSIVTEYHCPLCRILAHGSRAAREQEKA